MQFIGYNLSCPGRYLQNFAAERGPFDGVLGYSMGCAAAFALLAEMPGAFRFAVAGSTWSGATGAADLRHACSVGISA